MKKYVVGRFSYRTDIGKVRSTNEDQALATMNAYGDVLLLICDGMGGRNKGDYASYLAKEFILDAFSNKRKFHSKSFTISWLRKVVRDANKKIYAESLAKPENSGMGTTLTIAIITKGDLIVGQIGDSRCYCLVDNKMGLLTEDQTEVMRLYKTHQITYEEMLTHPDRHIITNALGCCPSANIMVNYYPYNDQTLLLCSDGLYNNVAESNIENILNSDDTTSQKVNQLIALANANGGSDNIGVVLWEANK